jgi:hypothetical protein
MSSRFVFTWVRPAGRVLLAAHRGEDLPQTWLIAEWPTGAGEPVKYWLSNLPVSTAKRTLVRWAKLRWRIEHDYREVKTGLGLDHYEGSTWQGWHHHTTLVSAASRRLRAEDLWHAGVPLLPTGAARVQRVRGGVDVALEGPQPAAWVRPFVSTKASTRPTASRYRSSSGHVSAAHRVY